MEKLFQYSVNVSILNKKFNSFIKAQNINQATKKLKEKYHSEFIKNSITEVTFLKIEEWEKLYAPNLRDKISKLIKTPKSITGCDEISLNILKTIRADLTEYLENTGLARPTSLENWCERYWVEGLGDIAFAIQEYRIGYQGNKEDFVDRIMTWIKKRFEEKILIEIL